MPKEWDSPQHCSRQNKSAFFINTFIDVTDQVELHTGTALKRKMIRCNLYYMLAMGQVVFQNLDGGWQWERGNKIRIRKAQSLVPNNSQLWVGRGLKIHCTTLKSYLCYAVSMSKILWEQREQYYEFCLGRGRECGAGFRKLHLDEELKLSLHKWDSMQ